MHSVSVVALAQDSTLHSIGARRILSLARMNPRILLQGFSGVKLHRVNISKSLGVIWEREASNDLLPKKDTKILDPFGNYSEATPLRLTIWSCLTLNFCIYHYSLFLYSNYYSTFTLANSSVFHFQRCLFVSSSVC